MQIGELLLQRRLVDWGTIAFAIADKGTMRLCSFLIRQGAIDFDTASRALGELRGSAAALQRHLEGRDESLADLLPDEVAKKLVAIPIGRLGNGALVVCVRDPSPALQARLARFLHEDPVLAVAPASYLERIVEKAYAPRELDASVLEEDDEPDVDVAIDVEHEVESAIPAEISAEIPIDVEEPVAPGVRPRRPSKKRALSVVIPIMNASSAPPAARDPVDVAISAFREIDDLEWLLDVAMQYVAKAWTSSLLLALRETRAVGVRGHGARVTPKVIKTFVVDIDEIALLARAREQKQILVDERPAVPGSEYAMLARTLGVDDVPIVAPISRGERVAYVLALGEPIEKDREDALVDLGLFVESLTEALART